MILGSKKTTLTDYVTQHLHVTDHSDGDLLKCTKVLRDRGKARGMSLLPLITEI